MNNIGAIFSRLQRIENGRAGSRRVISENDSYLNRRSSGSYIHVVAGYGY